MKKIQYSVDLYATLERPQHNCLLLRVSAKVCAYKNLPLNESLLDSLSGTKVWSVWSANWSRTDNTKALRSTTQSDLTDNSRQLIWYNYLLHTVLMQTETDVHSFSVLLQQPPRWLFLSSFMGAQKQAHMKEKVTHFISARLQNSTPTHYLACRHSTHSLSPS